MACHGVRARRDDDQALLQVKHARMSGRRGAVDVVVGFDPAWTDNAKAPGAIAALSIRDGVAVDWHPPPALVSFSGALEFIRRVRSTDGVTLVALDQPTIVANATGDAAG